MIQSVILLRILNSHDILHVLYNAYRGTVARTIGTNRTNIRIADVVADRAVFDIVPHMLYGRGELVNVSSWLS